MNLRVLPAFVRYLTAFFKPATRQEQHSQVGALLEAICVGFYPTFSISFLNERNAKINCCFVVKISKTVAYGGITATFLPDTNSHYFPLKLMLFRFSFRAKRLAIAGL